MSTVVPYLVPIYFPVFTPRLRPYGTRHTVKSNAKMRVPFRDGDGHSLCRECTYGVAVIFHVMYAVSHNAPRKTFRFLRTGLPPPLPARCVHVCRAFRRTRPSAKRPLKLINWKPSRVSYSRPTAAPPKPPVERRWRRSAR